MFRTTHTTTLEREDADYETTVHAEWSYEPEDRSWHCDRIWGEPHELTPEEVPDEFETAWGHVRAGHHYNPNEEI